MLVRAQAYPPAPDLMASSLDEEATWVVGCARYLQDGGSVRGWLQGDPLMAPQALWSVALRRRPDLLSMVRQELGKLPTWGAIVLDAAVSHAPIALLEWALSCRQARTDLDDWRALRRAAAMDRTDALDRLLPMGGRLVRGRLLHPATPTASPHAPRPGLSRGTIGRTYLNALGHAAAHGSIHCLDRLDDGCHDATSLSEALLAAWTYQHAEVARRLVQHLDQETTQRVLASLWPLPEVDAAVAESCPPAWLEPMTECDADWPQCAAIWRSWNVHDGLRRAG